MASVLVKRKCFKFLLNYIRVCVFFLNKLDLLTDVISYYSIFLICYQKKHSNDHIWYIYISCSVIDTSSNCTVSITGHLANSFFIFVTATKSYFPFYRTCMLSNNSEWNLEHLIHSTTGPYDVSNVKVETAEESTHCRWVATLSLTIWVFAICYVFKILDQLKIAIRSTS